jgi:2-polyprenyl-6-methoxyphenol hydroxylase-like FAD-dependent oxidoreductase
MVEFRKHRARRAVVIGGSMSGLFCAALLRRDGWVVDVFERSPVELAGRGAGITVHPELIAALALAGANTARLGVEVQTRIVLDRDGAIVHRYPTPETLTSWDRLQRMLRALLPDEHYHLGETFAGLTQEATRATVQFQSGRSEMADLVIGADGFRSSVRAQLLPALLPDYAGYVVWRGAPSEADLPSSVLDSIFSHFTMFLPPRQQVIGYPIAGFDDDIRPGHRRYNFIWYRVVDTAALADLCTDRNGRTHSFSIPPPLIRDDVVQAMRRDAAGIMPNVFLEVLARIEKPFFTPIYDMVAPRMAFGCAALVGDAASVTRPHMGFGVSKAADDAMVLAAAMAEEPDVAAGLARFNANRQPLAERIYRHGRKLGAYFDVDLESDTLREIGQRLRRPEVLARHLAVPHFLAGGEI